MNTNLSSEQITEIERQICVMKEKARACHHNIPFKNIPIVLLGVMLTNCAPWFNMFLPKE